jgi:hypothetical protein
MREIEKLGAEHARKAEALAQARLAAGGGRVGGQVVGGRLEGRRMEDTAEEEGGCQAHIRRDFEERSEFATEAMLLLLLVLPPRGQNGSSTNPLGGLTPNHSSRTNGL